MIGFLTLDVKFSPCHIRLTRYDRSCSSCPPQIPDARGPGEHRREANGPRTNLHNICTHPYSVRTDFCCVCNHLYGVCRICTVGGPMCTHMFDVCIHRDRSVHLFTAVHSTHFIPISASFLAWLRLNEIWLNLIVEGTRLRFFLI